MDTIARNLEAVRARIAAALSRAGRPPDSVTLVGVTKTFPADMVRELIRAGIADIGENRVQELIAKAGEVSEPCRWHLIGPLQRNKARKVVGLAHLIQAIDGVAIAQAVDRIAGEQNLRARILLEVNTSGEDTKHGVGLYEAPRVAEELVALQHLDWIGLMTIGPFGAGEAATRACFRRLARLGDDLRSRTALPLPELSMGMSDDFEMAIEEGATIVRLGRVITGERK
ncbi:MAG TPA: YggS family pyridoxal phosphate-dependent enzyme [Candidatus Krumholzibacteria bacterium]